MDFKHMFDTEELPTVLNAFDDAGLNDVFFAVINEENNFLL